MPIDPPMPRQAPEGARVHRLRRAHWQLAVAALEAVIEAARPADAALQELFRSHHQAGARDRANVSGLVYGVLRDVCRLQAIAGESGAATLCALHALREGMIGAEELVSFGFEGAAALAEHAARLDDTTLTPAQRLNVPDVMFDIWCSQLGEADASALAQALNQEASVDLRVNLLRATREEAQALLSQDSIESRPTPLSPLGLRLSRRAPLHTTRAGREGVVEPQDEGSQLIALLVGAQPGEAIADYCAGAGGKTLALGAAMRDRGRLVAFDTHPARLKKLPQRAQRAGLQGCRTQLLKGENDPALEPHIGRYDAVLVDAPCSGSGTWRRHPEVRLRTVDLERYAQRQAAILASASALVRPGGRLVYATCSLLTQENEAVVERFLREHPSFAIEDAGATLRAAGVPYEGETLKLYPHRHGTDGFFAARFRKS